MMTVGLVLGMIALTMFFGGVEEEQRNPNSSPDSIAFSNTVEVPLTRNRMGHYVVTGLINDTAVEFLLDTGATDVVIPEDIARRLRLPVGRPGRAMTANGAVTIYRTRIPRLSIGAIQLYDVEASINPSMHSGAILLGMSALGKIEFLQQGNTLTLRQRAN